MKGHMTRLGLIGVAGVMGLSASLALGRGGSWEPLQLSLPAFPSLTGEGSYSNRIYGRVLLMDGGEYKGFIRWNRNEGSWADFLQANKALTGQRSSAHRRDREIKVFGLNFSVRRSRGTTARSGIRFGHIRRIEILDDDAALVITKSGDEIEFDADARDLGEDLQELVVEDPVRGVIALKWRDLDVIEFMSPDVPRGYQPSGRRLFGTLLTRSGQEFTGYVTWDLDEIFSSDILDGVDQGVDVEIPFGEIARIGRESDRSAQVLLSDGGEILLSGTNDVDHRNSGISISDPDLGQILVRWDDFEALAFHGADVDADYSAFDGGYRLQGTVVDVDGHSYEGFVRWDNDEAYSWEMLDGFSGGTEFQVEFGKIARISRDASQGVEVELIDGRRFRLRDSNDVNGDNRGIFVIDETGDIAMIEWSDFAEVDFKKH
jgi:hypothetical protein